MCTTDQQTGRTPSSAASASSERLGAVDVRVVDVVVVAVIPTFRQVRVQDADGNQFALTRATRGIDIGSLSEGQNLRCTVTRKNRVLAASMIG